MQHPHQPQSALSLSRLLRSVLSKLVNSSQAKEQGAAKEQGVADLEALLWLSSQHPNELHATPASGVVMTLMELSLQETLRSRKSRILPYFRPKKISFLET